MLLLWMNYATLSDFFSLPSLTCKSPQFIDHILEIFAFFMFTGVLSTLLLPETKQRSLEDISNESQENFIQGVAGAIELGPVHDGRHVESVESPE